MKINFLILNSNKKGKKDFDIDEFIKKDMKLFIYMRRINMCELFEKNGCTGCVSLEPGYNIDENKKMCPDYIEWIKKYDKGEQMKL